MSLELVIIDAKKARFEWGEQIDGFKFYSCHDAQLDILASPAKYTAAFWGTGAGKTAIIPLWLYKKLFRYRQSGKTDFWRALVVSPSIPTFESSQLQSHILSVFDGTPFNGSWNAQKKTYSGQNFEIVVRTAENEYARLSGGQFHAIAADECWQMTDPQIFAEIRRRSNILDAPVLLVTTPNIDSWLYEEIYQPWEAGSSEFFVSQTGTASNPKKTPEEHAKFLDTELQKLGKAKFDRMYGGQFTQLSGLVYECFGDAKSEAYPVIASLPKLPRPAVRAFGMIDWGYNPDPTAAYLCVETDDNLIYIVEEIFGTKIEIDDLGRRLKEIQDRWSMRFENCYGDLIQGGWFDNWYCDTSRPESAALIRRFGLPVRNRKVKDISAGVAIVDQMFRCKRLRVFDTCTNLIREAKSYPWKDNHPRPGNDHAMDSLRYGISSYMDGKTITFLPDEALTGQTAEQKELETAQRLGLAKDLKDLTRQKEKSIQEKQAEHMLSLMMADDPD